MDKVQDPNDVKKYYRKATLLCHPDRIQSSDDPEKVYIANRCFAALTEAYNLYKVSTHTSINFRCRKKQGYSDMKSSDACICELKFVIFNIHIILNKKRDRNK